MKKGITGLWIGLILVVFGIGCFVVFNMIGSTADEQGMVHEPFALLPTGALLLFVGVFVLLATAVKRLLFKK